MSKNISKGLLLEKFYSKRIHCQGIPLLVSPFFLREMGAGQIDLAIIVEDTGEKTIKIYEVKSSLRISHSQRKRLAKSAQLLSHIFGLSTQIYLLGRLPK